MPNMISDQNVVDKQAIDNLNKIPEIQKHNAQNGFGQEVDIFSLSEGANGNKDIEIVVSKEGELLSISFKDSNNRPFESHSTFMSQEEFLSNIEEIIGHDLQSNLNNNQEILSAYEINFDEERKNSSLN